MYEEYNNDEYASENENFGRGHFDPAFFPDEEETVCDTEFESTARAEERVVSPGTEDRYWIAKELDPHPENLFDSLVDRLQLLHGAKILGINHHRSNASRSFGLAVRWKNKTAKLEDIAPQYPRAATSRHAINAEELLKRYTSDLQRINAIAIINYFGGVDTPSAELENQVKQLRADTDDAFRLLLTVATSRSGEVDPIAEALTPHSPHRAQILKGHDCSRRSLNRIATFFDYIGIPEKRNPETSHE